MNLQSESTVILPIKLIVKLIFAYWLFMSIGISCFIICIGCISIKSSGDLSLLFFNDETFFQTVSTWCEKGASSVPLDEIIDQMLDTSGGVFAAIVGLFQDFDPNLFTGSWNKHATDIFRDVTVLAMAQIFIILFRRLRTWMSKLLKGCIFSVVLAGLHILYICVSYFVSDLIIYLLEKKVGENQSGRLYLIVFLTSCAISGLITSYLKKGKVFYKILAAVLKPGFDACRIVCIRLIIGVFALTCSETPTFLTMYYSIEFSLFTVIVTLIFYLIDLAEKRLEDEYKRDEKNKYPMVIPKSGLPTLYRKK